MEKGPHGGYESYGSFQRRMECPPQTLKEEIERLYLEAPTKLGREILGKILEKLDAKERAQRLASYIATADPKDITTYYPEKKLGIFLVCDTTSSQTYRAGETVISQGDKVLQLHIPPRNDSGKQHNLFADISESLQLVADYIQYHCLNPKFITGCTYEPLVSLMQKRHGFSAARVDISVDWADRVKRVFHRYIDPNQEPKIGFVWISRQDFLNRVPPKALI